MRSSTTHAVVSPAVGPQGSALALGTFLVTLSVLVTAPSAWDPKLGFPPTSAR